MPGVDFGTFERVYEETRNAIGDLHTAKTALQTAVDALAAFETGLNAKQLAVENAQQTSDNEAALVAAKFLEMQTILANLSQTV